MSDSNGAADSNDRQAGRHDAYRRTLDDVRRAILRGHLVPGERLIESDLVERFAASRGAVRSALVILGNEGLVERARNRGARVRMVTLRESVEITEVRIGLESLCAAKAAANITDDEAVALRGIGSSMEDAVGRGDLFEYSELNHALHLRVRELSQQQVASELIERLRGRSGVTHQFHLALQPGRPSVSLPEHLAIIESVAARDPEAAEAAMRRHVESVLKALRTAKPIPGMAFAPGD